MSGRETIESKVSHKDVEKIRHFEMKGQLEEMYMVDDLRAGHHSSDSTIVPPWRERSAPGRFWFCRGKYIPPQLSLAFFGLQEVEMICN